MYIVIKAEERKLDVNDLAIPWSTMGLGSFLAGIYGRELG